jgi:hypothetical protein
VSEAKGKQQKANRFVIVFFEQRPKTCNEDGA